MTQVFWIAAVPVLILVAWAALKAILTFAVPQRVTGALLLKQELKKRDIPYSHLPSEFFNDGVRWAESVSMAMLGYPVARKAEFVRAIETLANMVALWRVDPDSPMFGTYAGRPSTYRMLFEKYSLR